MPPFDDAPLTPTERRLLDALAARNGSVVTKETLLAEVWGLPADTRSRTLYSTVDRLRKKVEADPKHPVHVLTIGREGYAFVEAPEAPRPPPTPPPLAPSGLVGRDAELAAARDALATGRPLILHGPAGVGKSALAQAALPEARRCDLSNATTRRDVLEAVAAALALPLRGDDPARELRRLARVAARGPGLLLDSADRAAAALPELLADWPPTPVVVTTQRALELPGASAIAVGPLAPEDGVQLFLRHVQRHEDVDRTALHELVVHLDGLPLAIELAARWGRVASPGELVARALDDRLPLVARDDDPRPPRHRSLEAALHWSWDDLPDPLAQALCALSIADGGVALTDLEPLLGPEGLDRVDRLVARSLATVRDDRVHVLGTVARFVRERLSEQPDLDKALRARHGATYARYGDPASLRRLRIDGARGVLALAPELGNLARAMEHGSPDDAAAAATTWAEVSRSLGSHGPIAAALETVARRDIPTPSLRARLWMQLGVARRYAGDADGAFAAFDVAAQWVHDDVQQAELDKVLGAALAYHGDQDAAARTLERARRTYRQLGDAYGEGLVAGDLATLDMQAGRLLDGVERLQDALRLLRRAGARFAEAVYLGNLGVLQMKLDRFAAARATYHQALARHRELGSTRFEALTTSNLGLLSALEDRADDAIAHYQRVIALAEADGDPRDVAIARGNLAWSLVAAGRLVEARRELDLAEDVFVGAQLPYPTADAYLTRAWLCRLEGDMEAADRCLDAAASLIDTHGFAEHEPSLLAQRGLLDAAQGDLDTAREHLAAAEGQAAALHLGRGWDGALYLAQLRQVLRGQP